MNRNIQDWNAGEAVRMRYFLLEKKVLIVLDDVDNSEQLNELCGIPAWFGKGSRIIITTTNEQLLISHGIERRFEVRGWSDIDALKLFCLRAFNRENPPETYLNLSKSFVTYANGLPLALEVLGSLMKGKSRGVWNSKLSELENDFDGDIMKTLKIGYEGLDPRQKDIFLDIACFFKGEDKDRVFEILDSCCGFKPDFDIDVLMKKSLITISDNMVWMHDLLQKMGQAIVGQQSKQPGGRSRLWLSKDIFRVLKENTGTPTVEGIVLDLLESKEVNPEAFSQMVNLRLLKVHNVHLPDGLNRLPKSLRFLEWRGYPLRYLPPGFDPEDLGELSMCHSRIEQLWKGKKNFDKLKIIKVSHSKSLTRTPDFEGMQNLERLDFEGCESLVQVHSSIGTLKKLTFLNLSGNHFVSLPTSISQLLKLENLYLSCCTRLQRLPVPSSEVNLQVIADDCNSLEMLQFPSDLNKLKFLCFSFINCSRMLKKERSNPITLTVLQRYLKGDPYAGDRYEIVMPGNEIPWWFTHQRMGPEVSVNLTPQWHDKWMGYALCAVFQVSGKGWEISAILEVNGKEKYPAPLLSSDVQPVSDHIWLVYVSRGISFGTEWQNSCDQLNFLFKSSGPCLVKSCGTRLVYESDVEELDDIATQSRRNVDEERDESDVEELDDIATQSRRNVDEEREESDVEELDDTATQSRRSVDEERDESDAEELDHIATQSRRNVDEERDESDVEELDDIATQSRRNVDEERDEGDVEELDDIATQSRRNVDEERDERDVEELDDIATQSRRNVDEERDESDVEELDDMATQSRRNVDEERVGCWVGCCTLIQRLKGHYS
ncbi:hypothetical protein C1H46_024706 [Malus baccata]|uniref:ADP-ribosyl cyclase/cyclic ADP-ribose hydrolase n=1 Tax=Malus baccata TaxID=106549 RepID=A0A540LTW3_MALBA|nr:hypothetical protein C1H46_024706 [Malus baccata]